MYTKEEENKMKLSNFIILSLPQRSSKVRTENCLLDGATKLPLYPKHLIMMGPQKRYLWRCLSTDCVFKWTKSHSEIIPNNSSRPKRLGYQ